MTRLCEYIQERLSEDGLAGLRHDPEALAHLGTCEDCFEVLVALQEVNAGLLAIQPVEPSPVLVEQTLALVSSESGSQAARRAEPEEGLEKVELAAVRVPVSAAPQTGESRRMYRATSWFTARSKATLRPLLGSVRWWFGTRTRLFATVGAALVLLIAVGATGLLSIGGGSRYELDEEVAYLSTARESQAPTTHLSSSEYKPPISQPQGSSGEIRLRGLGGDEGGSRLPVTAVRPADETVAYLDAVDHDQRTDGDMPQRPSVLLEEFQAQGIPEDTRHGQGAITGTLELPVAQTQEESPPSLSQRFAQMNLRGAVAGTEGRDLADEFGGDQGWYFDLYSGPPAPPRTPPGDLTIVLSPMPPSDSDLDHARRFLSERARISDLTFQEPRGYWANTYVPGDPILRRLQRRLTESQENLIASAESGLSLASHSRMVAQPFDPPPRSALAVYLAADRSAVQGPSRVLLQVGLQGTAREHGRRPAMNIGVVLDLTTPPTAEDAANIQALLSALSEASTIGDRFSLTVAGRPGGMVIPPGSFRYGEVVVATEPLFDDRPALGDAEGTVTLDLLEAFQVAIEAVRTEDDPSQPLGSSLMMLVTPRILETGVDRDLERMAHLSAVGGIPVSVVAVGRGIDLTQLDRIALAGQGSRRLLDSIGQADGIVASELTAASRAVARAVRLRIRLAPGVQLVDVLGSYRLDAAGAERVRQAEQSIDQRLARSLGIQADRGEDEDGIQVVIPVFYAEDSHVILIDAVVPGPGPVAEVTVRYKDLVHLRNSVARDHLALQRGSAAPGPLDRNVFKNLLAFELSETLKRAGSLVREGRTDEALAALEDFASLLRGLRQELGDLATDPDVETDIAMLARYLYVLERMGDHDLRPPNDLADSLLYAGYLKQLPPPGADSP